MTPHWLSFMHPRWNRPKRGYQSDSVALTLLFKMWISIVFDSFSQWCWLNVSQTSPGSSGTASPCPRGSTRRGNFPWSCGRYSLTALASPPIREIGRTWIEWLGIKGGSPSTLPRVRDGCTSPQEERVVYFSLVMRRLILVLFIRWSDDPSFDLGGCLAVHCGPHRYTRTGQTKHGHRQGDG